MSRQKNFDDLLKTTRNAGFRVNIGFLEDFANRFGKDKLTLSDVRSEILCQDIRTKPLLVDPFFNLDTLGKDHEITESVVVQIVSVANIAQPFRRQNENSSNRLLVIKLSDGHSKITAVELETLRDISCPLPPGGKILIGPRCRVKNGKLLLTPANCKFLGGNVPQLVAAWTANRDNSSNALRDAKSKTIKAGMGGPPSFELKIGTDHSLSQQNVTNSYQISLQSQSIVKGNNDGKGLNQIKIQSQTKSQSNTSNKLGNDPHRNRERERDRDLNRDLDRDLVSKGRGHGHTSSTRNFDRTVIDQDNDKDNVNDDNDDNEEDSQERRSSDQYSTTRYDKSLQRGRRGQRGRSRGGIGDRGRVSRSERGLESGQHAGGDRDIGQDRHRHSLGGRGGGGGVHSTSSNNDIEDLNYGRRSSSNVTSMSMSSIMSVDEYPPLPFPITLPQGSDGKSDRTSTSGVAVAVAVQGSGAGSGLVSQRGLSRGGVGGDEHSVRNQSNSRPSTSISISSSQRPIAPVNANANANVNVSAVQKQGQSGGQQQQSTPPPPPPQQSVNKKYLSNLLMNAVTSNPKPSDTRLRGSVRPSRDGMIRMVMEMVIVGAVRHALSATSPDPGVKG
eukprot:gene614-1187_t